MTSTEPIDHAGKEAKPSAPGGVINSIEDARAILEPIMHAIVGAAGNNCEVVLHDLTTGNLRHSIVSIENGHVTGRSVGGPSTNLGIGLLNDEDSSHDDFGYAARTSDGRELRSSSVYFHDPTGHVVAALCINVDLTPLQVAAGAITSLLPDQTSDRVNKEVIAPGITSILDEMIADTIDASGKTVALMDKADRIEILRELNQRGAFRVKRSVEQVARWLGISKVTAYGYLDIIRNE